MRLLEQGLAHDRLTTIYRVGPTLVGAAATASSPDQTSDVWYAIVPQLLLSGSFHSYVCNPLYGRRTGRRTASHLQVFGFVLSLLVPSPRSRMLTDVTSRVPLRPVNEVTRAERHDTFPRGLAYVCHPNKNLVHMPLDTVKEVSCGEEVSSLLGEIRFNRCFSRTSTTRGLFAMAVAK